MLRNTALLLVSIPMFLAAWHLLGRPMDFVNTADGLVALGAVALIMSAFGLFIWSAAHLMEGR